MILRLLAAALLTTQAAPRPAPEAQPLVVGGTVVESLAGGDKRIYRIEVPAGGAARVVIAQEGIDVGFTLRRNGSATPEHGLDLVAGPAGEEAVVVPVDDRPAAWLVFVNVALPRAAPGQVTIRYDLHPADERARAAAAAWQMHQAASDSAWIGDGPAFQRARDGYAAAAAAALAAGETALAAEATFQCARIHDNLGDTAAALEWQQRALPLFRDLGRQDRESRVLNRLGDLSRKLAEVANAEQYFEQALPLARASRDSVSIADVLNNSGLLMLSTGRYEDAIERFQDAIPLAQEVNSANVEGALLNNSAQAYSYLGQYDRAVEMHQQALTVVARMNLPRRSARTLHLLATAQFEGGDRAGAQQSISRSLALYQQALDRTGTAQAMGFDALMKHASGEIDAAIDLFGKVRPLLQANKDVGGEAGVLTAWADAEIERGHAAAALAMADEAVRLTAITASPHARQKALYVRARALAAEARLDEAIQSIAETVESVESMRARLQRSELRTSYLAAVRRYFDLYIDLLQRQGDARAAFAMSERSRARTLLEGLAESAAKIEKGVDRALAGQLRSVQASLNAKENYRAQLAAGTPRPAVLAAADRDIARLLDQWHAVRARIRAASPAYWALQQPEPVGVERLQEHLLDDGSALVQYHLGATRSYVWVVDRQSISTATLPASADIAAVGRRFHDLLSRELDSLSPEDRRRIAAELAALGRRLSDMVWQPVASRVRGKRVVIAADGVLHYIPFAALPDANGSPLVARHEVVYVPSASVVESLRRHSRPLAPRAPAAVFADPVFSANDPRLAATASVATGSRAAAADDRYARLQFSRMEADAIGAVSSGAFRALDFSASKQTLLARNLKPFRILHFATHGSLDTERPELSGLVLSLRDAGGKAIDGHLRLHEIYNLDLNADLVVLSACRTALGQEVHGEGLIGLTRGFMYAGASRVVSSVWNVDDRASARLMSRFYDAMLTGGLTPAAALRTAQLALLNEPRWSNPHYWAAFGLQGEWR